ncbi:hypothetical protein [Paraburkholderia lacunae]|uniref:hypothetical protein n=1 Tax=Paraburkholderia lacunae TaxID=2211104 RepID=UPI0014040D45|nr:hypothetical protein [Paraburkholderia lacunae]
MIGNFSRRLAILGTATLMTLAQTAFATPPDEPHLKPVATISDTRFATSPR